MADKQRTDDGRAGRFAYEGLERVMHEKARLGILTSLASAPEGLSFTKLKQLCALSDGNLSRHLQTLEEAGLVRVNKSFHERKPLTVCRLSASGRKRFLAYLAELEQVVRDAASLRQHPGATGRKRKSGKGELSGGMAPA
ncbi:transcriptional regulator [Candidatus Sumerlaeota bacterium]